MNVVFSNSVLLPFLAAIAIPILLHLFARARPPLYRFSSLQFLLRISRKNRQIRLPVEILVLILRTLLFAAVILAFLQPFLFTQGRIAGGFQKKNMALIVDATASMGYTEGAQTRFASACAQASEIINGLSSGDSANLIWLDSKPEAVFPEMSANFAFLKDSLRRTGVTCEHGDIETALRLAVSLLEKTTGAREVCIISDFQKSAWKTTSLLTPPGVRLIKVRVGTEQAVNTAVTELYASPDKPVSGEEVSIYCKVSNFSPLPQRAPVFLTAGESRQSRDAVVPPWSDATLVFKHKAGGAGFLPITASLAEDRFTRDDARQAVLRVRDSLSVGLLDNEPGNGRVWRRAIESLGWAKIVPLSADDLSDERQLDILFVAGWNGTKAEEIRNLMNRGCAVVCWPDRSLSSSAVSGLAVESANHSSSADPMQWEESAGGWRIKVAANDDPLFAVFAGGDWGDPARGLFRGRFRIKPDILPGGVPLVSYEDGSAALTRVANNNGGVFFLWNMPLSDSLGNWPAQFEFLPFMGELILTSRGSDRDRANAVADLVPGQALVWQAGSEWQTSEVSLRSADGQSLAFHEERSGNRICFTAETSALPGLYAWRAQSRTLMYSMVNFPVVESDLRLMAPDEIERADTITVSEGRRLARLREGLPLWPILLAAAAAAALLEGLILWRVRSA